MKITLLRLDLIGDATIIILCVYYVCLYLSFYPHEFYKIISDRHLALDVLLFSVLVLYTFNQKESQTRMLETVQTEQNRMTDCNRVFSKDKSYSVS